MRSLPVGATFVALLVASCRQIVGIQGDPPTENAPKSPADASTDTVRDARTDASEASLCGLDGGACGSCLASRCCAQVEACEGDHDCGRAVECLQTCDAADESCAAGCVHVVTPTLSAVLACRAKSCATPCGASCGGILGVLYPDYLAGSPDCAACATTKACDALTTCASDASCISYAACIDRDCAPLDRSCLTRCEYAVGPTPGGDALLSAIKGDCATECRLGSNWDCVGKYAWPLGVLGTDVTFNFRAIDTLMGGKPFMEASVSSCPMEDTDCRSPLGTGTTDANGYVAVRGALTESGSGNAAVFDGYLQSSGGGGYPTLGFIFPPLAGSLAGDSTYAPYTVQGVSMQDFAFFSLGLPLSVDATKGHLLISIYDCVHVAAAGMSVETSPPGALVAYIRNGTYAAQATTTDASGLAIVVNVPPGPVVVSIHLDATGELVSQSNVFVRAQTISEVLTAPLP